LEGFEHELVDAALLRALHASQPLVRAWSLFVLARRGEAEISLDALPLLEDPSRAVRLMAIRALARLKHPAAAAPLRMVLRDRDEHIKGAAAFALGALQDTEAVGLLHHALSERSVWVRRNAAWALLALGTPETIEAVGSLQEDNDQGVRLLAQAARARLLAGRPPAGTDGGRDAPRVGSDLQDL